ncbi:hypothetical protein BS47DRAFT_1340032 [Hydnum rufescens UP504]|uniref:L-2-hydroxyglutarate dehydrogenase, mitochondrial n=1 Tax=Hydnum rufescens UP504 TaxID=1448309 RepID=A0A9P6B4K3_9AGAM|nr:hypothetical protein BS47DRAFT_1340032 [Hydnum rufescens UP504]
MAMLRPAVAALNASGQYSFRAPSISLDHLVVGGGVVGLAITRQLARLYPKASTILVERHGSVGQETSSRNSEVIHAGLYFPRNSLKTRLCIKGRELLYEYCGRHGVPHRRIGKLVVAQQHQLDKLAALYAHTQSLGAEAGAAASDVTTSSGGHEVDYPLTMAPPTRLLSGEEARHLEPDLSPSIAGAVLSSSTGIIDSHALMQSLEKEIGESEGADIALNTRVVRVDRGKDGWVVQFVTSGTDGGPTTATTTDAVHVRTLINSSGLSANLILNSIFPERRVGMYFARGMYVGYSGKAGVSRVRRLIYPVPDEGKHGFPSLGTHLTMDLGNQIRFGPDLDWLPAEAGEEGRWERWVEPRMTEERLDAMYESITTYLAGVEKARLRPDYVGIRPKLVGPKGGFQDFVIRVDREGAGRMVSLLGIESPGLTSCLALAETVGRYGT